MAKNIPKGNPQRNMILLHHLAAEMSPDLCKLFQNHLRHHTTGAADVDSMRSAFRKLKRLDASTCPRKVKEGVGKAILTVTHPVVVFFDCISYLPEQIEKMVYVKGHTAEFLRTCKVALDSFKALTIAYGRQPMSAMFGDPTLDALLRLLDRAASCKFKDKNERSQWHWMWLELVCVGASICLGEDMQQRYPAYNEHTCRVLGYLSWIAHGRKDSGCPVKKFWDTRNPAEVRHRSRLGASCLPSAKPPSHGIYNLESYPEGHRFSSKATKKLCRLARVFQLVFRQYILSITGTAWAFRKVKSIDGIVRANTSPTQEEDLGSGFAYAGVSRKLDLSLPEVQAAYYANFCCEIKYSARPLLEYFFRASSRQVELMHFHPKNAHTTVWLSLGDAPIFNMTPTHTVAVITTESGLQFILDPTAAQYGWKEIFAPRGVYTRHRVDCEYSTKEVLPLEETPEPREKFGQGKGQNSCVAEHVLEKFKNRIPNGDLSRFVDLPEGKFKKECRKLEMHLKRKMGKYSKKRAKLLM